MAVTYITRDGTKIDGTTGQDHLLEVIYGHALTRMLLRPFLSPECFAYSEFLPVRGG